MPMWNNSMLLVNRMCLDMMKAFTQLQKADLKCCENKPNMITFLCMVSMIYVHTTELEVQQLCPLSASFAELQLLNTCFCNFQFTSSSMVTFCEILLPKYVNLSRTFSFSLFIIIAGSIYVFLSTGWYITSVLSVLMMSPKLEHSCWESVYVVLQTFLPAIVEDTVISIHEAFNIKIFDFGFQFTHFEIKECSINTITDVDSCVIVSESISQYAWEHDAK